MTDRYHSFTVALKDDLRDDDASWLLTVLSGLPGVVAVTPNVVDLDSFVARERVRDEMRAALDIVLNSYRGEK